MSLSNLSNSSDPLVLQCPEFACRSSLARTARQAFAGIARLELGAVGCRVRIDVPRLRDRWGLSAGVHIELYVTAGVILTASGAIGRNDSLEDVSDEIGCAFAVLEGRLRRLSSARERCAGDGARYVRRCPGCIRS